jgi:hypothetical protein
VGAGAAALVVGAAALVVGAAALVVGAAALVVGAAALVVGDDAVVVGAGAPEDVTGAPPDGPATGELLVGVGRSRRSGLVRPPAPPDPDGDTFAAPATAWGAAPAHPLRPRTAITAAPRAARITHLDLRTIGLRKFGDCSRDRWSTWGWTHRAPEA